MGHLAERYRVSEEAVWVLRRALERGGGQLAQFSHPDLGLNLAKPEISAK